MNKHLLYTIISLMIAAAVFTATVAAGVVTDSGTESDGFSASWFKGIPDLGDRIRSLRGDTVALSSVSGKLQDAGEAIPRVPKFGGTIDLKYDDRYSFTEDIASVKTSITTSHQCGSDQKDKKVLTKLSDREIVATGCGRAKIRFKNGKSITVRVQPAMISLVMILGQSNAEGSRSNNEDIETYQKQWIVNREGSVYNTYAPSVVSDSVNGFLDIGWFGATGEPLTVKNAADFIPDSLTDNSSSYPWRRTNNLTDAPTATGKSGFDSGLAYGWAKESGEKVWVLNASQRAARIDSWDPANRVPGNNYYQAVNLYRRAEKVLAMEIAAGHYRLSKKGIYWMQGESDRKQSEEEYMSCFTRIQKGFLRDLDGSEYDGVDQAIDFTGIILVRGTKGGYKTGVDLGMTGPRKALRHASISTEGICANVFMATDIGESWYDDVSVKNWFKTKYGDDDNYAAMNPWREGQYSLPESMVEVHNNIHYSQLAYNEVGYTAAKNIVYMIHLKD